MDPQEKLDFIQNIEQHPQRSEGWFKQREGKLTSSDAATALGINPYQKPIELLFKKCWAGPPFKGNVATLHGQKYEDEAIEKYCRILGKKNYDFGLIELSSIDPIRKKSPLEKFQKNNPDIDISFIAGSPDGIAIDLKGFENLILLEVKCPYRRKIINGYCPDYYYPQVQLNMAIFDIDKADFIEYTPAKTSPKFLNQDELNIVRIHRDHDWFSTNVPILHAFWQDVLKWRSIGIENHPEYEKYAYKEKEVPNSMFIEDPHDDNSINSSSFNKSMFRDSDSSRLGTSSSRLGTSLSFSISDVSSRKNGLDFSTFDSFEEGEFSSLKLSADMFR